MTDDVTTRTVELATADGPMQCFEARPSAPAGRAVVVVQEAFGVNPYIERVTQRFAAAGFDAVAPAFFHRAGGGTAPYDDFAQVIPLYEGLTDDGILIDLDAAFAHLERLGHHRDAIGVVGFCFGGRVTFLAAARRTFGAAVSFYGGGIVTPRFPQFPALVGETAALKAAWLGLFGDEDGSIPVEDVEALRVALRDVPVAAEIVRYESSEHGFFCDERPSYDPAASDDAWTRTIAWFDRHLGERHVSAFPPPDHCDLCEAARITPWYHEDDVCWIAECEICAVPMVVWRSHGVEPPVPDLEHMHGRLAAVVGEYFEFEHYVDDNMRNIPDHYHADARPKGGFFGHGLQKKPAPGL